MLERFINQGPEIISQLETSNRDAFGALLAQLQKREINDVVLVGCGTSLNAALILEAAFAANLSISAHNAFEWLTYWRTPGKQTLVVGLSQSGESSTTITALEKAAGAGALTVAITANTSSTLARRAQHVLNTHCSDEPRGPKTKGFLGTTQVGLELLQRLELQSHVNDADGPDAAAGPATQLELPSAASVADALERNRRKAQALAPIIVAAAPLLVVGGGPAYGLATEAALKFQEISKLHSVGYEVEEAMHGPLYAMGENAVAVVLSQSGSSREKCARFIWGARKIGLKIIQVGPERDAEVDESMHLSTPAWKEKYSSPILAIPIQLLALEAARLQNVPQGNPFPDLKWNTKTFNQQKA